MDRKDEILQKGNQLMEAVFRESLVELLAEYKKNEEENLEDIKNVLQRLIDNTIQKQLRLQFSD